MKNEKKLTLSIVIPVFNEQDHLKACLSAIAAQTVIPDEVLVVDNNSTDSSAAIAANTARMAVVKATQEIQGAPLCSAVSFTSSCKCSKGTSDSSIAIRCEVTDPHSRPNHVPRMQMTD